MARPHFHADVLTLESGHLCLDFANTAEWHASPHPEEHLNSYADLVEWARSVGLLSPASAGRLIDEAARRPAQAAAVLAWAIALREAIYRLFSAIAAARPAPEADLAFLNSALREAHASLQVSPAGKGFVWQWAAREDALDQMLWPVARDAADLLTSEELDRVGECADDRGCGWLFIDTSKNRTRRWCGPGCANRAKAQRHYARLKERRNK